MVEIIGRGEKAALLILKDIFGTEAEYVIQCPLKNILNEEFIDDLSPRQQKETLDIVIKLPTKMLIVRVQDKHHVGYMTSCRDNVQKKTLEWSGHTVMDLWFHDCPELWKDIVNEASINEVKTILHETKFHM